MAQNVRTATASHSRSTPLFWLSAYAAFLLACAIGLNLMGYGVGSCLHIKGQLLAPLGMCVFRPEGMPWYYSAWAAALEGVLLTWPLWFARSVPLTVVAATVFWLVSAAFTSTYFRFYWQLGGSAEWHAAAAASLFLVHALRCRVREETWRTGALLGAAACGLLFLLVSVAATNWGVPLAYRVKGLWMSYGQWLCLGLLALWGLSCALRIRHRGSGVGGGWIPAIRNRFVPTQEPMQPGAGGLRLWASALAAFVLAPLVIRVFTGKLLPFELYVQDCHWRWLTKVCLERRCPPLTPLELCERFSTPDLSWVPLLVSIVLTGLLSTWTLLRRRSIAVTVTAALLAVGFSFVARGGFLWAANAAVIMFVIHFIRGEISRHWVSAGVILGLSVFVLWLSLLYFPLFPYLLAAAWVSLGWLLPAGLLAALIVWAGITVVRILLSALRP